MIAAVLVPIDIAQIVVSSIKIHNKTKSAVVKEMEEQADVLQNELWNILKDKKYAVMKVKTQIHLIRYF